MMESLDTWWSGLSLITKFFYVIGMLSTAVLGFQTLLILIGLDGFDADVDVDVDLDLDVDTDIDGGMHTHGPSEIADDINSHALGFLSIRTITAFLVGFGWVGAILLKAEKALWIVLPAAILVGFALMFLIFYLMRFLWSMRESGTLDYHNAVGENATVYLPIPPKREGRGQVQVIIQGRLQTIPAITSRGERLENRTKVLVVDVLEDNTLVVVPDDIESP